MPQFYADFLNKPSATNNFQTMNRYWMEDSFGKYGVELTPFGPYRMPRQGVPVLHLGLRGHAGQHLLPDAHGTPCNRNIRTDLRAAWEAEVGAAKIAEFDNIFYTFAGEDQSSTWQEFGEMKFLSQDTVSDAFGPKAYDPTKTVNWAPTRYVPWSSWAVATNIWPNASGNNSTEAESSGMAVYAHELSHNLSIPDNYNNPFAATQQRTASGMWDMMSRGSFNGPGGQHTRFQIPPTQGGALGAQHNLRNKRFLNFIGDGDILRLNRDGLAQTRHRRRRGQGARGRAQRRSRRRARPAQRRRQEPAVPLPHEPDLRGSVVHDGHRHERHAGLQRLHDGSRPAGRLGLLLPGPRRADRQVQEHELVVRLVQLLRLVHRRQPAGHQPGRLPQGRRHAVKATVGDERQTNDGSFNAGLNSGSTYEYKAENNRLHFYVINKRTDADGMLRYTVAVRSLDGAGPQTRGV